MSTQVIQDLIEGRASIEHMPAPFIVELRGQMMEHARQGRVNRALEYAQALLLASPESAESWLMVARMYRHLDQLGMSARCVEQAFVCDSNNRAVRLERGELWVALGRPKQGLDEIVSVFLEGFRADLKPQDQDLTTLRAGAIIESVDRVLEEVPGTHQGR